MFSSYDLYVSFFQTKNNLGRLIKMNKKNAPKKEMPFVSRTMLRLAPLAGVKIFVEPKYGYVGQIICPNGKIHYFRNTHFDLNPLGATEICKDKDYSSFFLKNLGYKTVEGRAFYSKEWCKMIGEELGIDQAYEYAKLIKFPVIVKPNSKSQGLGVYKATNKKEFYAAIRHVFKIDKIALVQRIAAGNDFRIVVLDGEVISAYQRIPFCIIGDGTSTISELHQSKQAELEASERDTLLDVDEFRLNLTLKQNNLTPDHVLDKGKVLQLAPNANLCSGGTSIDFTDKISPEFSKLCIDITRDMGLRLCGVDLMIEGTVADRQADYLIVEVNSAPGLDNFAASGDEQAKIVDGLYLKLLKAIAKI